MRSPCMRVTGARPALKGLIPTAWYPSAIDVSADGRYLAIGSLFGLGAGDGTHRRQAGAICLRDARIGARGSDSQRRGAQRLHHRGEPEQSARARVSARERT